VQVVRAGDAVKIGLTRDVERRLRALATGSAVPLELLATLPGGRRLEARLPRRRRRSDPGRPLRRPVRETRSLSSC